MDELDLGYLMKRTLLHSTHPGANAPFSNLLWALIFISAIGTSTALYGVTKMGLVSYKHR